MRKAKMRRKKMWPTETWRMPHPFAAFQAKGWETTNLDGTFRTRRSREDSRDWRRAGRTRGCADCGSIGLQRGPLRDASDRGREAAPHPRAPDHGVRRAGLLELPQERVAEYRAVGAKAGDAARRL